MNIEFKLALSKYNSSKTREQFDKAISTFESLSEFGNLDAEVELALLYLKGEYVEQDYKKSITMLSNAALKDHRRAQKEYADCLYYGKGITKNESEAVKWYNSSASQNYVPALLKMAEIYYSGCCELPSDKIKAMEIFENCKNIACGNGDDEYQISIYFDNEKLGQYDMKSSIEWCIKAAAIGNAAAQNLLGTYYEKDIINVESPKYIMYYEQSAKCGYCYGIYNYALCLLKNGNIEDSIDWLKIGLIKNDVNCMWLLGVCYDPTDNNSLVAQVDKDTKLAVKYYTMAASREYLDAYIKLAHFYFVGIKSGAGDLAVDHQLSIYYCREYIKRVDKEITHHQQFIEIKKCITEETSTLNTRYIRNYVPEFYLAQCYFNASGVTPPDDSLRTTTAGLTLSGDADLRKHSASGIEKNYDMAINLMKTAAESGLPIAQEKLGYWFKNGITGYLPKDDKMSIFWLQKAAKNKSIDAITSLAAAYWNGQGIDVDKNKALELMTEAANLGSLEAANNLGKIYSNVYNKSDISNSKLSIKWYRRALGGNFIDTYILLSVEINDYLDYADNIDIKERLELEDESLMLMKKVTKLNNSVKCDEVSKIIKCLQSKYCAKYNIADEPRELPPHKNFLSVRDRLFNRWITMEKFIQNGKYFNSGSIIHIIKELCNAFIHCQKNNFSILKLELSKIYILLPRTYEIHQMYYREIGNATDLFSIDLKKIMVGYLINNIINIEDITDDLFQHSRIVIGDIEHSISFSPSCWKLDHDVDPILRCGSYSDYDFGYLPPEIFGNGARYFGYTNAYTLGLVIKSIILPRLTENNGINHRVNNTIKLITSSLLDNKCRERMTLEQVLLNIEVIT